jgi:hypothetical protein
MNNLAMILVFFLALTIMFMSFPQRAEKASKSLSLLMKSFSLSKFFDALIQYFKRGKK